MAEVDFRSLLGSLSLEEKTSLLSGRDLRSTPGVARLNVPPLAVSFASSIPSKEQTTNSDRRPILSTASDQSTSTAKSQQPASPTQPASHQHGTSISSSAWDSKSPAKRASSTPKSSWAQPSTFTVIPGLVATLRASAKIPCCRAASVLPLSTVFRVSALGRVRSILFVMTRRRSAWVRCLRGSGWANAEGDLSCGLADAVAAI